MVQRIRAGSGGQERLSGGGAVARRVPLNLFPEYQIVVLTGQDKQAEPKHHENGNGIQQKQEANRFYRQALSGGFVGVHMKNKTDQGEHRVYRDGIKRPVVTVKNPDRPMRTGTGRTACRKAVPRWRPERCFHCFIVETYAVCYTVGGLAEVTAKADSGER